MTNLPGSFLWYELLTPDLAGARKFYDAVAGLRIPAEPAPGPMDYRTITAPGGGDAGGAMQLSEQMLAGGAQPGWFGYVGVADVDAAAAQIEAAGGQVHMPPTDITPNLRIAMLADPQGAAIYVMRSTPPPGEEEMESNVFHPEKPGHVGWNELHATDGGAAFAFYAGQFGWEKSDAMDMGPMGTYQMFKPGGTDRAVGGMMTGRLPRPQWLYYFNVADIDAACARVGEYGGEVMHGPSEVPGDAYIVQGADPQGAMFALIGPRKAA